MEPIEGNEYKVQVTIPAEDVDRAVAQAYKDVSKEAKVKGFRKGKVPRSVLDANVGRGHIRARAGDTLVADTFPEAIEQLGIIPISMPQAAAIKSIVDGEDYEYSGEVEVRPQVTLTSVDGIKVEVEPPVPEEREVDAQIQFLRDQHATLEVVDDRGIENGDFVLLSFTGYVDDEPYEENQVDGLLYELGAGDMPAEFDDALLGAKAGDEVVATFVVPETSMEADLVGKTAKSSTRCSRPSTTSSPRTSPVWSRSTA
jgi:trigger factor